jgi:hypothetical protein
VTRYLSLAEYFWLAEQVTGTDAKVLVKASRAELADSALHAPAAGFGDDDFYPTSSTRRRYSHAGWHGTTRSLTATSVLLGPHSCCSSNSTVGAGNPIRPMSTRPRRRCWRSLPENSTRTGSRIGCDRGSTSTESNERHRATTMAWAIVAVWVSDRRQAVTPRAAASVTAAPSRRSTGAPDSALVTSTS